ncbi:MAG: plastocyanin/azurin family copper-binding protein [Nitrospiraceae bacterium]|nr:plastocyanin/azurin family copper-binding protein [Nitrospiraceae bacterium]
MNKRKKDRSEKEKPFHLGRPGWPSMLPAFTFVLAVFLLAGASARAADFTVALTDRLTFAPRTVTMHTGDVVVWKNTSSAVHTVTCDPGLAASPGDASLPPGAKPFNSGFLRSGAVYRHRFTVPGTYHYFCLLHESSGMTGTIVVK